MQSWTYTREWPSNFFPPANPTCPTLLPSLVGGFSSYGPGRAPGIAKLHKLYVHPDQHRRGHGGRLLDHAEETLAAEGYVALELAVNKASRTARAAYERRGFAVREEVVVDIGNGFVMDDFLMEKRLGGTAVPPR